MNFFPKQTKPYTKPKTQAETGFVVFRRAYFCHNQNDLPLAVPQQNGSVWVWPEFVEFIELIRLTLKLFCFYFVVDLAFV
jgi:hypothetical protein